MRGGGLGVGGVREKCVEGSGGIGSKRRQWQAAGAADSSGGTAAIQLRKAAQP